MGAGERRERLVKVSERSLNADKLFISMLQILLHA